MQRFLNTIMKERDRLLQVIESENLSATQFAKEVGIQAGTLSNIISGRNNPSLDVLQRVLNRFRTISSDWLILGVGSMYRPQGAPPENVIFDIRPQEVSEKPAVSETVVEPAKTADVPATPLSAQKLVSKIVIFYTDGTFEER